MQFHTLVLATVAFGVIASYLLLIDATSSGTLAMGTATWVAIGVFVSALLGCLWFVQRAVLTPMGRLATEAMLASETDPADLYPAALVIRETESRNEIHRLDVAIKRLLRSVRLQCCD
jgi:HAMP domain-containing protein